MLEILATLEEYQRILKNDQIIAVKFENIAEIILREIYITKIDCF